MTNVFWQTSQIQFIMTHRAGIRLPAGRLMMFPFSFTLDFAYNAKSLGRNLVDSAARHAFHRFALFGNHGGPILIHTKLIALFTDDIDGSRSRDFCRFLLQYWHVYLLFSAKIRYTSLNLNNIIFQDDCQYFSR
jgi:hypothetical protein